MTDLLKDLNEMQRKAVSKTDGPVLVLAGAGSGKTRVITYRIAYLIQMGIPENNILALTFTNKAAGEMKERVQNLVGSDSRVWVATFHSFCVSILRKHIEKLGYKSRFTIYDDSDTLGIIKQSMKELGFNDKELDPKSVRYVIDDAKNKGLNAKAFASRAEHSRQDAEYSQIYTLYEKKCKNNNALDFNDLLLKTLELFLSFSDVAGYYSDKFQYIHVDEYQDTNDSQYQIVQILAKAHKNLCVVGDDDQSIYGWRGASIRNILEFEKDYPNTTVIRLEQNYRSTGTILKAANSVIANNVERKDKELWTEGEFGEKIIYYRGYTEREEANYIIQEIRRRVREDVRKYSDFAVLYRTNAQSRIVEEAFMRNSIPYNIYGGLKFYSRKEIKDIIAYLTVAANPDDDVAMKRVINLPKRGIGDVTINAIEDYALFNGISFYDALDEIEHIDIKDGAKKKVAQVAKMITLLMAKGMTLPVGEFVKEVIETTGLIRQYEEKENEENISRIDNSYEFIKAAEEFQNMSEDVTLGEFLENILLVTELDNSDDGDNKVSMMTLHSAKGLEFPVVFLIGMEQGLFPSHMSMGSLSGLEEERRLCYVGITRAREILYLSNAESRMVFGKTNCFPPSCFLQEIPMELLDIQGKPIVDTSIELPHAARSTPAKAIIPKATVPAQTELAVGQKVSHVKFGVGTIIKVDGVGEDRLVSIAFDGAGIKKLSTAYAPLKVIE